MKTKVFEVHMIVEDCPGTEDDGTLHPYLLCADIEKAIKADLPAGVICTSMEVRHKGFHDRPTERARARPNTVGQGKVLPMRPTSS